MTPQNTPATVLPHPNQWRVSDTHRKGRVCIVYSLGKDMEGKECYAGLAELGVNRFASAKDTISFIEYERAEYIVRACQEYASNDALRADKERLDWMQQMAEDCEGRILTRVFIPDGKPLRDKIDAARAT